MVEDPLGSSSFRVDYRGYSEKEITQMKNIIREIKVQFCFLIGSITVLLVGLLTKQGIRPYLDFLLKDGKMIRQMYRDIFDGKDREQVAKEYIDSKH